MKVVSENTGADLARKRASQRVDDALRELTANLLRVVRGAGRPHDIADQSLALTDSLVAYREATGVLPFGDDLAAVIQPGEPDLRLWGGDEQARHYAHQLVIKGSLQVTASRLLHQPTQEAAGRREMHDGMVEIEAMRAATREQAKAESRAYRAAQRVKPKPRKRIAKPKAPR